MRTECCGITGGGGQSVDRPPTSLFRRDRFSATKRSTGLRLSCIRYSPTPLDDTRSRPHLALRKCFALCGAPSRCLEGSLTLRRTVSTRDGRQSTCPIVASLWLQSGAQVVCPLYTDCCGPPHQDRRRHLPQSSGSGYQNSHCSDAVKRNAPCRVN